MYNGMIKGKSGTEYLFTYSDINVGEEFTPGVYIPVKRMKDRLLDPPGYYKALGRFGIVEKGISTLIKTGEATGYLYRKCDNEKEVDEVLDDLDEPGNIIINDKRPE